ncbi:hypothetical protein [Clostridium cylindrosporum]|uniref:Uncharacterized protein n=1 Tax=Clostridium cylindrosporum DSM 605 TaxID=1121307 RepID=A0A0J8DBE5_CLOCY|nr:hypothetical protein [Clostridium cylindrosporum]KMT21613.1 hypothetical protein CLCY_2c03750 [Clostridium cylindrosporum DSM 605]
MSYISRGETYELLDSLNKMGSKINFEEVKKIELKGDRVEYNLILNYIEDIQDDEQRDNLRRNISKFKDLYGSDLQNNFLKIIDYVLLEIPRVNRSRRVDKQIESTSLYIEKLKLSNEEHKSIIAQSQEKMGKMQGDFISILSIFSAVIIAFFGGLNFIASALNAIDKINSYKLTFVILIIGFIMFNIIYMLLYTISKITGRKITIDKIPDKCSKCKKMSFMLCLRYKYPIVYVYNFLTLILCVATLLLYTIDRYNIFTRISYLKANMLIVILSLFILVLLAYIFFIYLKSKKNSCDISECAKSLDS